MSLFASPFGLATQSIAVVPQTVTLTTAVPALLVATPLCDDGLFGLGGIAQPRLLMGASAWGQPTLIGGGGFVNNGLWW